MEGTIIINGIAHYDDEEKDRAIDYMEGSGGLQPFRWFVAAPGFMLIFSS